MQPNLFPKEVRLQSYQYKIVFENVTSKIRTEHYTFLISDNKPKQGIGIIIAKKKVRKASQRNLCKRIIKEFYRKNKQLFIDKYMIVIATSKTKLANKEELWNSLNIILNRLKK